MKKSFAALALAGTIALAASAPAMAVDYPAPVPGTVSSATVTVGGTVVFSGGGFTPGETIVITITFTAAPQGAAAPGTSNGIAMAVPGGLHLAPTTLTATANASGAFSTDVALTAAGTYQLTAEGATSHHTVTSTVVAAGVSGAGLANTGGTGLANTGGTGLANTGVDSSLILWGLVGAGALAAGTVSVVVARRRAKNETAATA
ncbi:LPXTG cell wall anchor domain-containing protein [Arthrobacter sp. FW306-2-2C-D06B]|uniref:LPXTG cell wall anchor domain-containing protein n=1 Tax=Arthrobacter sp. FW306-2-2C-D06B TaxID=2879618 RepID=UPI001F016899|nr:LPXTG cell wall anchor domain-containing protein [Arthrobacter sp. FW306-2-2C-D06B]UKA58003.1 LPXTG cell wall anchor domain-containing protein [Arthrobacter sp. FW306-2-2C-D06B]